ncbi:hypothetical protein NADFUDRAFT_45530 [Nadsonia fulvescens var. elongata DSM 6958]|uniref:Topoisomerase I damage affected protein 2 n=1 Tax=Nadsonia fulvescens var. elongata DSM 6958 TaxID=857566 RepID=A0A1E3PQA2_9ASCO|nr:hypothetical protein NADFUDRAFT_45530 [Nadsonia fulvescens var. elongata DSM 6958]
MIHSDPQLKARPQLLDQGKLSSNCPIPHKTLFSICDEMLQDIPKMLVTSASLVTEGIMSRLAKVSQESAPSYKFIVNATLTPGNETLETSSTRSSMSAYWDTEKDGSWTYLGSANAGEELIHAVVVIHWIYCS